MMRTRPNLRSAGLWSVQPMPRAPEKEMGKNQRKPYLEPALVPLGEKPKMCECKLVQGTRQISPVT